MKKNFLIFSKLILSKSVHNINMASEDTRILLYT